MATPRNPNAKRGRPKGSKNKDGHAAGRPEADLQTDPDMPALVMMKFLLWKGLARDARDAADIAAALMYWRPNRANEKPRLFARETQRSEVQRNGSAFIAVEYKRIVQPGSPGGFETRSEYLLRKFTKKYSDDESQRLLERQMDWIAADWDIVGLAARFGPSAD
jgi:hypothetical protein